MVLTNKADHTSWHIYSVSFISKLFFSSKATHRGTTQRLNHLTVKMYKCCYVEQTETTLNCCDKKNEKRPVNIKRSTDFEPQVTL